MLSKCQLKRPFLSCHIPILLAEAAHWQLDFHTGAVGGLSNCYLALVTTNREKENSENEDKGFLHYIEVFGTYTLKTDICECCGLALRVKHHTVQQTCDENRLQHNGNDVNHTK